VTHNADDFACIKNDLSDAAFAKSPRISSGDRRFYGPGAIEKGTGIREGWGCNHLAQALDWALVPRIFSDQNC